MIFKKIQRIVRRGKNMGKLKISAPWVTYAHQMKALFGEDPDIQIKFDDVENRISLYVKGTDKANALTQLLPAEKEIGGVTVRIEVIPANLSAGRASLIETALTGNPVFSRMLRVDPGSSNAFSYAIFRKKVAQYWNDNLGDPHGNVSCLYQDLAREILGEDGSVMFCTDNIGETIW